MTTKTYSAHYDSGLPLFQKKSITEAFNLIPAGSRLISGNSNRTDKATGKLITVVKATYRVGGQEFVLTEDKQPES